MGMIALLWLPHAIAIGVAVAQPQPPAISARVAAIQGKGPSGDTTKWLWEPGIAAGPNKVIVIATLGSRGVTGWVAYSLASLTGPTWSWSQLADERWPEANFNFANGDHSIDSSIAYNAATGDFVCFSDTIQPNGADEDKEHVSYSVRNSAGTFGAWQKIFSRNIILQLDRPFVISGTVFDPTRQEFYAVWMSGDEPVRYRWGRSIDNAATWGQGLFPAGTGNAFCAVPTSMADGTAVVTYRVAPYAFQFVRGIDDSDPLVNAMSFEDVLNTSGTKLQIAPSMSEDSVDSKVPAGIPISSNLTTIPAIAGDPTDGNRAYIAFADTASGSSTDLDIFCIRLTRNPTDNRWTASSAVRVNTDPASPESDQFLPSMTVDSFGRIHVVFYDDRLYAQDDSEANPKFEVFYAISTDQGQTWTNTNLGPGSTSPAYDQQLYGASGEIGEFGTAIASWSSVSATTVWAAYIGTKTDGGDHKSVVWVSRIIP